MQAFVSRPFWTPARIARCFWLGLLVACGDPQISTQEATVNAHPPSASASSYLSVCDRLAQCGVNALGLCINDDRLQAQVAAACQQTVTNLSTCLAQGDCSTAPLRCRAQATALGDCIASLPPSDAQATRSPGTQPADGAPAFIQP